MTTINQKEYLKKYLGIGRAPGEKKKNGRKKKSLEISKLKIIDDDAEVLISQEIQDDISAANEDAPQIVAVIDERPPSLRIDEQTKNNLWAPIGETSVNTDYQSLKLSHSFKLNKQTKSTSGIPINLNNSNRLKLDIYSVNNYSKVKVENEFDSSVRNRTEDHSPPRKRERNDDHSPPRRRNKADDILPTPIRGK
ncbi:hypothetical protein NQ314_007992 [Rhamnusium bicolor]|uniref:Uncharacterized protein n=1 Tax=Rhamnusium bicolor TaxID=1586634 RepID=A0AAV8YGW6_9CUCU|nr:hypothetical protein NQ314_007992 [Rhamnusium bicolor]